MRNLTRFRNSLSLSSINKSWDSGNFWSVPALLGSHVGDREQIANDFDGYVRGAYKSNGVVFTTILIRQAILSEARFQYQRLTEGRPGDLFGDQSLSLLENPWPNGTTGEMIDRMEQDGSLAGNFYATRVADTAGERIRRLRPDWTTIITESPMREDGSPGRPTDIGARVAGYLYRPPGDEGTLLAARDVVHYSPIPDPVAQWRGMSWITAITREVMADNATSKHKLKFFENGATAGTVITYDKDVSPENVKAFAELYAEQHSGADKAYKTVHLGGGADKHTVGTDLKQLDFKVTQGAAESRMAAASLVGAVLAQFSEGMAGSSLNAGNFNASKRRFADVGARPLWRKMAASLSKFTEPPSGTRLWYDDRDIPFLQDDAKDAAAIRKEDALTIESLIRGGFDPDSAVAAVTGGDFRQLDHTGYVSVQLQIPGTDSPTAITVPIHSVPPLLAAGWELATEKETAA